MWCPLFRLTTKVVNPSLEKNGIVSKNVLYFYLDEGVFVAMTLMMNSGWFRSFEIKKISSINLSYFKSL